MTFPFARLFTVFFSVLIVSSSVGGAAFAGFNGEILRPDTDQLSVSNGDLDGPPVQYNPGTGKGKEKPDEKSEKKNGKRNRSSDTKQEQNNSNRSGDSENDKTTSDEKEKPSAEKGQKDKAPEDRGAKKSEPKHDGRDNSKGNENPHDESADGRSNQDVPNDKGSDANRDKTDGRGNADLAESKRGDAESEKPQNSKRDTESESQITVSRQPSWARGSDIVGQKLQIFALSLTRRTSASSSSPPGLTNNSSSTAARSESVTVPQEQLNAREYRDTAIEHLESASALGNGNHIERSLGDLEDTYTYHLDGNRTTSAAIFRADHRIASSTLTYAPNATGALIAADRELALQALADAERTRTVLNDRNLTYNRTAVAEHVSESRRAIEQARHIQDRSPRPVAAIEHYRHAWTAAQRALDVMDEDVEPQVSLTTEFDFPHDESVTRTVNGTVFDVRPYELNGSLNFGNETYRLNLSKTTTPATVLELNRTVELGPQTLNQTQVYTVSVAVSDPGHDVADRGYDPDAHLDRHQPQTSTTTVGFDGDGLIHAYEEATTGTDPFNPDSNSSVTASNESNNGVVDGLEDLDNDTVSTFYEMQSGTDPLEPDTDDDRLLDGFELRINALDATNPDTDGDGTPDAREDLDGDGLTTLGEQRNGTSPDLVDTDLDRLTDAEEVFEYGTDPVAPDTDEDGLLDGEEIELGTDPLVADSDGDGVLDGNEMYTTERTNESLGATVAVDGEGNAAKSISVEQNDEPSLNNSVVNGASASDIVRIDARTTVESANVTLNYDSSKVSNESDVSVFRFNREKQTFVELDSTVDTEINTVSGTTQSFGTFVVLEESEWAAQFKNPLPNNWSVTEDFSKSGDWSCEGENGPTCDTSGDGVTVGQDSTKTAATKSAGTGANETFSIQCIPTGDGDCIPVTDSDNDGTIDYFDDCPRTPGTDNGCPQDSDGDGINDIDDDCPNEAGSGPDGCPSGGYDPSPPDDDPGAEDPNEPIDEGQQATNSTFGRSLTFRDAEEIVVEAEISGEATGERSEAMFAVVDEDLGVTRLFHVEGTGDDGTRSDSQTVRRDLSEYADETVAFRLVALNDSKVTLQSMRISYDSDGDGLADSVEKAGIRTGFRGTVYTDPYSADTDGDGLTDGEEVGARSLYDYGRYFRINSDPTKVDTDGDGLDDYEETHGETTVVTTTSKNEAVGLLQADAANQADYLQQYNSESDPLYADSDFDGFGDYEEVLSSTDPDDRDTDGDSIVDGRERQVGGDPTLHDFRPPEISVRYASFRKPAFSSKTHYRIIYTVEDASGVKRTAVVKGGTERYHQTFPNYPVATQQDAQFTTKFFETSLDSLTGTTVFITANDRHDNSIEEVGYQRANFYGSIAGELNEDSIYASTVSHKLGQLSGFAASLGTTGKEAHQSVEALLTDPLGFIEGIQKLISLLDEAGILEKLIESFAQGFEQKQEANNPYEPGTELYDGFRTNWYAGYVAGSISQIAIGASATKAAKGTKYYGKVEDFVDSSGTLTVLRRTKTRGDYGKTTTASRLVADGGIDRDRAKVIAAARSAGSVNRMEYLVTRYDVTPNRVLTDAESKRLARFLSHHDEEGARFLESLAPETRGKLLGLKVQNREEIIENIVKHQSRGEISSSDSEMMIRRLGHLSNEEVEMSQDTLKSLANGDARNLKDTNYELEVAVKYLDQGENVIAVGRSIPNSEVDVLIKDVDGHFKIVEAKNRDWGQNSEGDLTNLKSDLGNKIAAYEREYGSGAEIIIEFSDDTNIPQEISDYIQRKQNDGYNVKLG